MNIYSIFFSLFLCIIKTPTNKNTQLFSGTDYDKSFRQSIENTIRWLDSIKNDKNADQVIIGARRMELQEILRQSLQSSIQNKK